MYQKTDTPEFHAGFVWQLCLIALAVLVVIPLSEKLFAPPKGVPTESVQTILLPWATAAGRTIDNGLLRFSGKQPTAVDLKLQVKVLVGMMITTILCPTLCLFWLRRRTMNPTTGTEEESWRVSHVFHGLCVVFTVIFAAAIVPIILLSESSHRRLHEMQAVQSDRDAIINDLNMISIDVAQFYILPHQLGGGSRSFHGYSIPSQLKTTEHATYAAAESENMVKIRAQSFTYNDASIEVAVDSTGQMFNWSYEGRFR